MIWSKAPLNGEYCHSKKADGRRWGTFGRYLPSGHLIYINKGTLFASAFDPDRLELYGTPTPVLEDVAYSAAWGSGLIDFSQTGTLVYRSSKAPGGLVTVQWLDDSGNSRPLLPVPSNYLSPTLSPDGSRLALISAGDLWVYELGRRSMTRLTFGAGYSNSALERRRPIYFVSGGTRYAVDARRWNG